jgi:hypothetical protein
LFSSSTRIATGNADGRIASERVKRKMVVGVFSTASDKRLDTLDHTSIDSDLCCVFEGEEAPGTAATSTTITEKMRESATRTAAFARR